MGALRSFVLRPRAHGPAFKAGKRMAKRDLDDHDIAALAEFFDLLAQFDLEDSKRECASSEASPSNSTPEGAASGADT